MNNATTARTLKALREAGWTADKVEYWNAFARIRKDLFNFGDIVAIAENRGNLIVQCTSYSNISNRTKKILSLPAAKTWLLASEDNKIEIWGWKKGKNGRWQPTIRPIILEDFTR